MAKQTKPALMQLEVGEEEADGSSVPRVVLHIYRAELVTGIVEVDSAGTIVKLGTHMHQPGAEGASSAQQQQQQQQQLQGSSVGCASSRGRPCRLVILRGAA